MTTANSISYNNLELFEVHLGSTYKNNYLDGLSKPIKCNRSRERIRVNVHSSKRRSATPYPRDTCAEAHPVNLIEKKIPSVEFDINQYYKFLPHNRKEWSVGRHVCMSPRPTTKRMTKIL